MMSKSKEPDQIIVVTGNEDDGWNVDAVYDEHKTVFACDSKQDAEDLADILNRCAWFEVAKL